MTKQPMKPPRFGHVLTAAGVGVTLTVLRLPDLVLLPTVAVGLAFVAVFTSRSPEARRSAAGSLFAFPCASLGGAIAAEGLGAAFFALADPPRTASGVIAQVPVDLPPSWVYPTAAETAAHGAFHLLTESGIVVLCGVLLVGLALRSSSRVPFAVLLIGGSLIAPSAIAARVLYGPAHPLLTISVLWAATVVGAWRLRNTPAVDLDPARSGI